MKRFVTPALLGVFGLMLSIGLLVETIAWRQLEPVSLRDLIESRPPPYANAVYWSPRFLEERWALDGSWLLGEDGLELAEFTGEYYNIRDGERVTVGQPIAYTNSIYLFGSSTIYEGDLPDTYTLASQLQSLVPENYRVVNRGIAANIDQQIMRRILATTLALGDKVVFYEPWNDLQPVARRLIEVHKTPLCRLLSSLPLIKSRYATAWTCQWITPFNASDYPYISTMQQNIRASVSTARDYVENAGGEFIYATPPLLWARGGNYTEYEQKLLGNIDSLPAGLLKVGEQIPSITITELESLDLYHLLDNEPNVFVTHNHVNEYGDALIAQALYKALFVS